MQSAVSTLSVVTDKLLECMTVNVTSEENTDNIQNPESPSDEIQSEVSIGIESNNTRNCKPSVLTYNCCK